MGVFTVLDGRMDHLRFYTIFTVFQSYQDYERMIMKFIFLRLRAMKHCLRLERFPSPAGPGFETARSADQRLTELTGLLNVFESAFEGECLLK